MKTKLLRFFEYDRIDFRRPYPLVGKNSESFVFDSKYQKAISDYHSLSKGTYYSLQNHGIAFCEQVGAIQIHDLTIEILPKIDKHENDYNKWHRVLLDMLLACKSLLPRSNQDASLRLRSNSVLELYFQKYIIELEYLLHSGLIKKYRKNEGNVKALKGQLLFSKQLRNNLVHAERFYTRHTVYDRNHALHQILRQALEIVENLNSSAALSSRINSLLLDWPQNNYLPVSVSTFDRIVLNIKSKVYKEALSIAKMILLNYHPDIISGRNHVLALMFNMNSLWEEFIYQRLSFAGRSNNWEVCDQKGLFYWRGAQCSKKLIPDIIIRHKHTDKRILIDTKWKQPKGGRPDDHDLRQILAYKMYFHADNAFLLYPDNSWKESLGTYHNHGYRSESPIFRDGLKLKGGLLFSSVFSQYKRLQNKKEFCEGELVACLKEILENG